MLCVAIKSVFRSVHVKDHGRAERLVRALENAEGKAAAAKGRPFKETATHGAWLYSRCVFFV